jgi:hypothetical protein
MVAVGVEADPHTALALSPQPSHVDGWLQAMHHDAAGTLAVAWSLIGSESPYHAREATPDKSSDGTRRPLSRPATVTADSLTPIRRPFSQSTVGPIPLRSRHLVGPSLAATRQRTSNSNLATRVETEKTRTVRVLPRPSTSSIHLPLLRGCQGAA